jgi:hypothetical protein
MPCLAESIPWKRFLGSLNVYNFGPFQEAQESMPCLAESIPGLLKRLQFRALDFNGMEYGPQHGERRSRRSWQVEGSKNHGLSASEGKGGSQEHWGGEETNGFGMGYETIWAEIFGWLRGQMILISDTKHLIFDCRERRINLIAIPLPYHFPCASAVSPEAEFRNVKFRWGF